MGADRPADAPIVLDDRHPTPFIEGGAEMRNAQGYAVTHLQPDDLGIEHHVHMLVSPGLATDWLAMTARRVPAARPTRIWCMLAKVSS